METICTKTDNSKEARQKAASLTGNKDYLNSDKSILKQVATDDLFCVNN